MGEINISREEQEVLKAIDTDALDEAIGQCLEAKRLDRLRILRLASCGPYVASKFQSFENALVEYSLAKAAKKYAETESRARRAGDDLAHAVGRMKDRLEKEQKEGQLFYIEDQITPPHRLGEHLTVRVNYRWRPSIEDQWIFDSITFSHDVDSRPDYSLPQPKRRPSARKQEQDRQEALYRTWDHLMRQALLSMRDYFREGGNGAQIPQTFQVKTDPQTRALNNFSAQFWRQRASAAE